MSMHWLLISFMGQRPNQQHICTRLCGI